MHSWNATGSFNSETIQIRVSAFSLKARCCGRRCNVNMVPKNPWLLKFLFFSLCLHFVIAASLSSAALPAGGSCRVGNDHLEYWAKCVNAMIVKSASPQPILTTATDFQPIFESVRSGVEWMSTIYKVNGFTMVAVCAWCLCLLLWLKYKSKRRSAIFITEWKLCSKNVFMYVFVRGTA